MNDASENAGFQVHDIAVAFSLLTILPVPVDHDRAARRGAAACWAFPLVGAALAAGAGLLGVALMFLGVPAGIVAALVLGVLAVLTGAMHEDGLADCADGLGGGRDKGTRLAIMKDSRIGAFGAVALGVALLARWSGIEVLGMAENLFWPLVAVGAVSRLPMVLVMFVMHPARQDGLAAGVGLPPPASVVAAVGLTFLLALICLGWGAFALMFWAGLATLPLFLAAQKLIGGHTGDILGGSQQLAEIAALGVAAALVA